MSNEANSEPVIPPAANVASIDPEAALRFLAETDTRFRLLFEQSPLSIQILSPDGRTLQVNKAWEELWGATIDDIAEYNMLEDRQLEERGVLPLVRRAFQGESVAIPEIRYDPSETVLGIQRTRPGPRWVRAFLYPVKDASGNVIEAVIIHEDVSERVAAEAALRESEERNRIIVETAQEGIWVLDASNRTVFINKKLADMLGYSPDEIMGRPPTDFIPPDDVAFTEEKLVRKRAGEVDQYDARYYRKDGGTLWVIVHSAPIRGADGRYAGAMATMTDITARKQAEAALLNHQAEIETLNARLRRSMAETHHRVKNNLQLIAGMLEMHALDHPEGLTADRVERLRLHLAALAGIHDLLTQQAKEHPDAQTVSAGEVLGRLIPLLQITAAGRTIAAHLEDAAVTTRRATSLAVIANEIINNAIKHGSGTVKVRFSARRGKATLSVEDDGPGFGEQFDPAECGTTGLALVQHLASWDLSGTVRFGRRKAHGARVDVCFALRPDIRSAARVP